MMFTCSELVRSDDGGGVARGAAATVQRAAKRAAATKSAALVRDRKGQQRRVDIHCHCQFPDVEAKVAPLDPLAHTPAHIFSTPLTREVNRKQAHDRFEMLTSIERRLRDMDEMGVDIQAISPSPAHYYYWTEPDFGAECARLANDHIAEICAKWPQRFVGLGTVPLQDSGLAIAELRRCVQELGMRGVEINSNVNGKNLTDPTLGLENFFRAVQELDVIVFIHPWCFTHAERFSEHYFSNVIGMPLETTLAAGHLIFDGVMDRLPKLKIVLAHGGGYIAHYHGRMDHTFRARPDGRVVLKRKPSTYLRRMYFDTITFDAGMLRYLVDTWGAEHVLLGTDYPYDMADMQPVKSIDAVPRLKRAEKDLIAGGNAARLLKLRR